MTAQAPSVAVVLPTYNRELTIDVAISSVLQQRGRFELSVVVVDDASGDSTLTKVKAIAEQDHRVTVIPMLENHGAPYCRNAGVESAHRADFIAFQDSDDVWLPGKLERQLTVLTEGDYAASACRTCRIGDTYSELSPVSPRQSDLLNQTDLLTQNFVSTQTLCMPAAVANEFRFDTSFGRFQDWDLAIRVAGAGSIHLDRQIGVITPLSPDSITRSANAGFEARLLMMEKYAELYQALGYRSRAKMMATAALVGNLTDFPREGRVTALANVGCPPSIGRILSGPFAERFVRFTGRGVR